MEIEAFVHGAMCILFGRCLLSNYLSGRDANKGACSSPLVDGNTYLVEETRPGRIYAYRRKRKRYLYL